MHARTHTAFSSGCLHACITRDARPVAMQDIEVIEGLGGCPLIEKLWLCENSIRQLEGLAHMTRLRELYIYSNRIKTVEGLDTLTGLEVGRRAERCTHRAAHPHAPCPPRRRGLMAVEGSREGCRASATSCWMLQGLGRGLAHLP